MARTRRAGMAALVVVGLLTGGPAGSPLSAPVGPVAAAAVDWPPSALVVSEVQTGGASASDEFVEIANQGATPIDLAGLELVYATASGSTVTRKSTWSSSLVIDVGRRILVANGAGIHAGVADAAYSGGFAATGGAVAVRVVGGAVVDAVGWGDASSAFVEGSPAPAPPAGSSLERRPGGTAGNGTDTNENAADWLLASAPTPQGLSAPPVPDPAPTQPPAPTLSPTPEPSATPSPTSEPSATPTLTMPPGPTPTPEPEVLAIGAARVLPDDRQVVISGVLTTALGALEAGRTAFVEDETGGIAIYLDAEVVAATPAGSVVTVRGTTDTRYGQRTLRTAEADVAVVGTAGLLAPIDCETGASGELVEGRRIAVTGFVASAPSTLADGLAVDLDDGTGPLRVVVTPSALGTRDLAAGDTVTAIGPLGQRDSGGTGSVGYRLYVTLAADLRVVPAPSPSPDPTPTPTPEATPTPEPTPEPTPTPTPTAASTATATPPPTASPSWPSIVTVRGSALDSIVRARGVVTAEASRLGAPALLAVGDETGGIVIRLPAGTPAPARGAVLEVEGRLARPYGQLEIRPVSGGLAVAGSAPLPVPVAVGAEGLGESVEGRLVQVVGRLAARPSRAASGDLTFRLVATGGATIKVAADVTSRIDRKSLLVGAEYRVIGIAGQRATRSGALDGYRVWARDSADLTMLRPAPSPSPRPSGSPRASTTPRPSGSGSSADVLSIAAATRVTGRDVLVEGVVTAPPSLLDTTGRRMVIQDATGAIEILLPKDASAPRTGRRVRIEGRVGTAYGSPRLRAETVDDRGAGTSPAPRVLHGAVGTSLAWRLVRVEGRIEDVRKLGGRWRAELRVGRDLVVTLGQPGAGIPAEALVEGRTATITGIVRLAFPTASDRRPNILPRTRVDVRIGAGGSADTGASGATSGTSGQDDAADGGGASAGGPAASAVPDADLSDLSGFEGSTVRVGGLVRGVRSDGFELDDGTATGRVVLAGAAADWTALVEPGDAVNVIGRVERLDGALVVIVEDPAAIVLGSDPGSSASADDATNGPGGTAAPRDLASERQAGLADGRSVLPGAGAGIATLVALALTSLAVTFLRRRHARRVLASRIAVRLAAVARRPERDASVGPPA